MHYAGDESMSWYQRAVEVDPSHSRARLNIALHLADKNDFTGVRMNLWRYLISVHEKKKKALPIPLSTCDCLSAAHCASLRFFVFHASTALNLTAAIAELHEILTMHPHDNEALYNLGWCEEKRGSIIDAANAYSSCLAAAPRRLDARLNLAALHHKHGEPETAKEEYAGKA